MNIKEIVYDSLKYPFSDWKRFLILGVIVLVSSVKLGLLKIFVPLSLVDLMMGLLFIFEFILGIIFAGYMLRIMKSSLNNGIKLPHFGSWFNLFINGIKVSIILVIYFIPVILGLLVFLILFPSNIGITLKIIEYYPSNIFEILYSMTTHLGMGIWSLISLFYMIIACPIMYLVISHIAYNDCKLAAAFRFREIFNKINTIGWKNFVLWYIVIGLLYLIILNISKFILAALEVIIYPYIGISTGLYGLIVLPFLMIYFTRAVALFYKTKKPG